jgi:hypothetical protein
MKHLGLQAEHLELPVRELPENVGIPTDQLPISSSLRERIEEWDGSLQSEETATDFIKKGRMIARDLQRELGAGWTVVYLDNRDVTQPGAQPGTDEFYWSSEA